MDPMAIMTILSARGASNEAHSALPNAPVVTEVEAPAVARVRARAAIAAGLHRLADVVAPPRATVCAE
jgi:hypothetical protein